nr:uncharacterized protein LOC113823923 [Penaeus vannamei]
MPEEWRNRVLVPIFKNRGDLQTCNNCRGRGATDAIFALRMLMEKCREGQKDSHCVFVDLVKAYDRMPTEELWHCVRMSGVAEKYVKVVKDIYDESETAVRCAAGMTEGSKVEDNVNKLGAREMEISANAETKWRWSRYG